MIQTLTGVERKDAATSEVVDEDAADRPRLALTGVRLCVDSTYNTRRRRTTRLPHTYINILADIDSDAYFKRSKVHHTRANNMKLNKSHASSVRHSHFFTHRVITIWNSLPNSIVVSPTVASFKRKLHSLNFMPWCCVFLIIFFLLGLLLEQGCPCLGALLALYVMYLFVYLLFSLCHK